MKFLKTRLKVVSTFALLLFALSGLTLPARAIIPGENFVWGINGHCYGTNYTLVPPGTVLSQIKSLGMTYYRLDVVVDTTGTVTQYASLFNQYVADAPTYGVKLLCMIYAPYNLSASWQTNYNTGYNTTYNFCKNYPGVSVIEEGNELDSLSTFCTGGSDDGASVGDYNASNMYLLGGCLSGMYAGAHAANPSVRCAIDCINHPHWGWFQVLQNDSVPWDITAVHWYTSSGSVLNTGGGQNGLDKFSAFGKKIWITEVNNGGGSGSGGTAGNNAEVTGMQTMLYDLYYYSNVEAILAYELYDDASGNYGFYSSPMAPVKPIVAAFKQWSSSTTGPCSLPIGHRIALTAASGYFLSENSSNNDYVQANSASTAGLPQYFDVVDSLWLGYGSDQISLWCENTGYYVSTGWSIGGTNADTLVCDWDKGPGNIDAYTVDYIGNGFSALLSQASGKYVSCNLGDSDLLMAQYATTPSGTEYLGLRDQGIAPYNPYNSITELGAGQQLNAGQSITSPNGHAELTMLSNGNVVLYNMENSPNVVEWQTNTGGNPGAYIILQGDGNLVVYTSGGSPLWDSATYNNTNPYMSLSNTGNLAVYTQAGSQLWQTNTSF